MRPAVLVGLLGALLASCSDGDRGGGASIPLRFAPDEARDPGTADDHGNGVDNGTLGDFARCQFNSDCVRGRCLRSSGSQPGICATLCGTVAQAGEFVTGTCARTQQCAFIEEEGVGFCTFPCSSTSDCPTASVSLECRFSTEPQGRFCMPRFAPEDDH